MLNPRRFLAIGKPDAANQNFRFDSRFRAGVHKNQTPEGHPRLRSHAASEGQGQGKSAGASLPHPHSTGMI